MNKRVSLKDIAAKVGVSIALVSYVLNNKKEGRIKKEVAQKIRETAKALNYRTNQIAKSLKTSKTFTIGLIVADISNPFSSGLARIIEDEADRQQYTVLFGSSDENIEKFEKLIDTFLNRQVDGLIIAPPENAEKQLIALQQQQMPFVLIDRYFTGLPVSYIALDNYTSSFQATVHLIRNGCKRPAMITYDSGLLHLMDRTKGYKEALEANSLPLKEKWLKKVHITNNKQEIELAVQQLLSLNKPPDAILFGSNSIADYGVKYINTLPVKVPKELSVITFDEPQVLDLFYAPLTYINQPMQEMGRQATAVLLENMSGNGRLVQLNMPGKLVVRASTRKLLQNKT